MEDILMAFAPTTNKVGKTSIAQIVSPDLIAGRSSGSGNSGVGFTGPVVNITDPSQSSPVPNQSASFSNTGGLNAAQLARIKATIIPVVQKSPVLESNNKIVTQTIQLGYETNGSIFSKPRLTYIHDGTDFRTIDRGFDVIKADLVQGFASILDKYPSGYKVLYAVGIDNKDYFIAKPVNGSPLFLIPASKLIPAGTTESGVDPTPTPTPTLDPIPTSDKAIKTAAATLKAPLPPELPQPINFAPTFKPEDTHYRIIYYDSAGNAKSFVFTFMPARETKLGNWNVPEARAGLPIQTKMRHKMQVIPGAGPIVQTIGVNGTTLTLVGALLGNEVIGEEFTQAPTNFPQYQSSSKVPGITAGLAQGAYPGSITMGAYNKVQELTNRLVYPGRPVTVEIKPSSNQATFQMAADGSTNKIGDYIRMTGVVTAVRIHYAHSDRAYYALDLFVTDYPTPAQSPVKKPDKKVAPSTDPKTTKPASKKPASTAPEVKPKKPPTVKKAFATFTTEDDGIDSNTTSEDIATITNPDAISPAELIALDLLIKQDKIQASPVSVIKSAASLVEDRVQSLGVKGNVFDAIGLSNNKWLSSRQQQAALQSLANIPNLTPDDSSAISLALGRF